MVLNFVIWDNKLNEEKMPQNSEYLRLVYLFMLRESAQRLNNVVEATSYKDSYKMLKAQ